MGRLIIVPDFASPPPPHQHGLDIGGTRVTTTTETVFGPPPPDPLDAYLAFYADENSGISLRSHFMASPPGSWTTIDKRYLISEWIEANCILPCLAQRVNGSQGPVWNYYFMDGTLRRNEFVAWAGGYSNDNATAFVLEFPANEQIGLQKECDEWMKDIAKEGSLVQHGPITTLAWVWGDTPAVEFKLRWSDYLVYK